MHTDEHKGSTAISGCGLHTKGSLVRWHLEIVWPILFDTMPWVGCLVSSKYGWLGMLGLAIMVIVTVIVNLFEANRGSSTIFRFVRHEICKVGWLVVLSIVSPIFGTVNHQPVGCCQLVLWTAMVLMDGA